MTLLHFCVAAWHGSARWRQQISMEICGQTEATLWYSSNSGHLSPLWFPFLPSIPGSSSSTGASTGLPQLGKLPISSRRLMGSLNLATKKIFSDRKKLGKNQHCSGKHLPKAGQTSVADFEWTLPAAWMKGNFLSLQFASDTQGTGFLNQPGHFKLSGNIPQNCHAQLQHSYRTLLDEIIPPTSSAEKSFTCFCFQLIMVYHWFIILDPTSVSFSPLMWSQKWYFLSSPCGELAFSDSNRHGRRCKRRVGETLVDAYALPQWLAGEGEGAMEMMNRSTR